MRFHFVKARDDHNDSPFSPISCPFNVISLLRGAPGGVVFARFGTHNRPRDGRCLALLGLSCSSYAIELTFSIDTKLC